MSEQKYLLVLHKNAAGQVTVPFDLSDDSDEAAFHRKVMIGHLVAGGHHVQLAPDGSHLIVHSGPLLNPEQVV